MIHEAEATSALSLLTSNSLKAVADLLTVLSQALSRKPWPSGAGKKIARARERRILAPRAGANAWHQETS
jgi:hypothetical protein